MKELEKQKKVETKTEVVAKKKKEVEYFLTGSLKTQKGHKVWELEIETSIIKEAQYKKDTVALDMFTTTPQNKMILRKGCVYIPALNSENARRKFDKNPEQSAYFVKPPFFKLWNQDAELFKKSR